MPAISRKAIKYHMYSRWFGRPSWNASYLFEKACQKLKPGDITIDAGANLGEITALLASTGATVHAFEPDPYTFERLCRNVGKFPNVHLHRKALSANSGTTKLFRSVDFEKDPDFWSQSSSLYNDKNNIDKSKYISIEEKSIIEFIGEIKQKIKLMKIDIEGAEVPLLESLIDTGLIDDIDRIFVETHEKKIPQIAERTHILRETISKRWANKINLDWH